MFFAVHAALKKHTFEKKTFGTYSKAFLSTFLIVYHPSVPLQCSRILLSTLITLTTKTAHIHTAFFNNKHTLSLGSLVVCRNTFCLELKDKKPSELVSIFVLYIDTNWKCLHRQCRSSIKSNRTAEWAQLEFSIPFVKNIFYVNVYSMHN